jgi:hypothetical protein
MQRAGGADSLRGQLERRRQRSLTSKLGLSMSEPLQSTLERFKIGHLVQVKRRLKDVGTTTGFVVALSDSLILFHTLDMDMFRLNGYTALRDEDISHYRGFTKAEYWQFRAVRRFHLKPVRPVGISVASLPELLMSVSQHYPLITLHPEKKKPDVCYIGSLVSMTEHTFIIEDLDCNGEWSGPRRMKFSDITRVDFGGGYEEALSVTAPKQPKIRR